MKRNFPSFIGAFEEYCKHLQVHKSFVEWSAVSVIAGALERKVWISLNNKALYPNMFVILESPAGIGRKTSTSSLAVDILRHAGEVQFTSQVSTQAALVEQLFQAGSKRRVQIGGKEYAMSAIYAYAPEAVMLLKESFGSITELFTDWYDCYPGYWSDDNGWQKTTKLDGTINIYNVCLNSLLCTTPEYLQKFMSKQDANGGFASRCLFIYEEDLPDKQFDWLDDTDANDGKELKQKLIEDLSEIHKMHGQWKVEREAKDLYVELKKKSDKWLVENKSNPIKTFKARKDITILKLAQVLAADASSEMVIRAPHIEAAIKRYEGTEPGMHKVFRGLYEDPSAHITREIFMYIKHAGKEGVAMKSIISKFLVKASSKNFIGQVVQGLVAAGKIGYTLPPAGQKMPLIIATADDI